MAQHGPFTHPAPLPSPQPHFATHIMWKVAKPGWPMGRVHPSNPWGSKRERSPMIRKSIMNESNECLENLKSLNIFMDFFLIHPKFMFFGYPKGLAHCFHCSHETIHRSHQSHQTASSNSSESTKSFAQKPTLGAPDKHATPLLQGRRSLPQFLLATLKKQHNIMQPILPPKWLKDVESIWIYVLLKVSSISLCQTESVDSRTQGPLTQEGTRPTFPRAMPQVESAGFSHDNHLRWIEVLKM